MAQSNGDEELRLIKELDDLFPDEELIVTEWDTHWPRIIDFILADRKQHELDAKISVYEKIKQEFNEKLDEIRKLVANYVYSEGCYHCEGDSHESDKAALAEALGVPMYKDNSGYDFSKFMDDTNDTTTGSRED